MPLWPPMVFYDVCGYVRAGGTLAGPPLANPPNLENLNLAVDVYHTAGRPGDIPPSQGVDAGNFWGHELS